MYIQPSTHYRILCDQQHGFCHSRSYESQTVYDFTETPNKREQSDVVFWISPKHLTEYSITILSITITFVEMY